MADRPEPQPARPHSTDSTSVIIGPAEDVFGLCDEFFRGHASPAVLAELRRFLTGLGHHPLADLGAFLTELSSVTLHADIGRPRHHEIMRAAELNQLLAEARLLPAGAHTRDVGGYRALEMMVRGPGEYWATADVIDDEGSGHVEVTVARASRGAPLTLADLQHPDYPGVTGTERHLSDGSSVTTFIITSSEPDGVMMQRAILARPDGTYVDVMTTNEDARTGGRTRPTPPLDAEAVLDKIADLRP